MSITGQSNNPKATNEPLGDIPADVRGSAMGMKLSINTLTDDQRTALLDYLFEGYCLECGAPKPCYCLADD